MESTFYDAIEELSNNNFTSFAKLVKENPKLCEVRVENRSLLLFAVLYDRVRATRMLARSAACFVEKDDRGDTIFHWAVSADARKCVKHILSLPPPTGCSSWLVIRNSHQSTPVHLAARHGHSKLLRQLLSSVVDHENFYLLMHDCIGQSPLHYAAAFAHEECCEILLSSHLLPIDQKDKFGHTPLINAAACSFSGADRIVRLFVNYKKFCATARDNAGRTALHYAVITKDIGVIDVMLKELKSPAEVFDNEARTPLHYAALEGKLTVVKRLLAGNAHNATRDSYGVSPAHYSAQRGYIDVTDYILRTVGGVEQYDSEGRSCFMWAVIANQMEMVNYFLSKHSPNRSHRDKYGCTALHYAAHIGSTALVKLLGKENWVINDRDTTGSTALHFAAGSGHTAAVRLLLMIGANGEHEDVHGRTAIFYACLGGQAQTLKVLVSELNCKAEHTDKLGRTAMHCAAFGGFTACIEVLLQETDCPIYSEDIDQLTPLHIACERGKSDCVKLLVQSGAAVNALSMVEDWTPLSCAQLNGHQQVTEYLQRNGALYPNQLRNLAALIIQKWWRRLTAN